MVSQARRTAQPPGASSSNQDIECPYPSPINLIRGREYPSLKGQHPQPVYPEHVADVQVAGTTYLDHAGTTPYPRSLIRRFSKELQISLFGNPHSQSPSSMLSTSRIDTTRLRLLRFFKADPELFDLVFVANATAAIKLVVDCAADCSCSPLGGKFWYGYHADSHTSLVGAREVASSYTCFASDEEVEAWLDGAPNADSDGCGIQLFAYPGQSNMNGRRLPLHWSGHLRKLQPERHNSTYTLLDAAALASTTQVDLSDCRAAPDFTAVSLYKIFGFPDLGALIVRKASSHLLEQRRYFGGGTVDMVTNGDSTTVSWVARKAPLHERLEDGTPPFHNIIALDSALTIHERLYGSMDNVSAYTCALSKVLFEKMRELQHPDGAPLCIFYTGNEPSYGNRKKQGPTIAFNIMSRAGQVFGKSDVEQLAIINDIQLRTGGVCNPGGIARSLNLSSEEMEENFAEGLRCGNGVDILNGKATGIIRVSLGAMSNGGDVEKFLVFLSLFTKKHQYARKAKSSLATASASGPIHHTVAGTKITQGLDKDLVLASVEEAEERVACPVAFCEKEFESKAERLEHYKEHRICQSKIPWQSALLGQYRARMQRP